VSGKIIEGSKRSSLESLRSGSHPGDWFNDLENGEMWIHIPGDGPLPWPYVKPLDSGACWHWDGNEERPSLTPSLHLKAGGETIWHGWFREGRLESV
jgi:hypothetical protein